MIVVLLLTFVSCDDAPDKPDSDGGQSSQGGDQGGGEGQGGGGGQPDPTPKATFTVTFIQEGEDPVIEKYEEGDPLWLHAPDLGDHGVLNYYYNWDAELDAEVTSDMTVTRIEDEGYAVFFMNVDEHAVKIIAKEIWTAPSDSDIPTLPEIEGYTGLWDPSADLSSPSTGRTDVTCWYYSTEKYSSTGMPKSFILYGRDAFTISEYPIQVSVSTLKYVNKTNFDVASYGLTGVNSDEAATMVSGISPTKAVYEGKTYSEKTDWLIQNLTTDTPRLINAIKVMRVQTEDNGWSIPTAGYCRYIGYALYALEGEDNYFSYLSNGLARVRFLNSDSFYQDSSSNKWMTYSFMEDGCALYGMFSTDWKFGGSFTGYLWPIKPLAVE